MKAVVLAFLFCACMSQARKRRAAPVDPLASFFLAQQPTGMRSGSRISQGGVSVTDRSRKGGVRNNNAPAMQGGKKFDVKDMAGISAPTGLFDPLGFLTGPGAEELGASFYRELELKNGRTAMLAALGFIVSEQFHPWLGGIPADQPIQAIGIFDGDVVGRGNSAAFLRVFMIGLAIAETIGFYTWYFGQRSNYDFSGGVSGWKPGHEPGNLGFDPMNMRSKDPEKYKTMQTRELNNARLAMLAIVGMLLQEVQTGTPLVG